MKRDAMHFESSVTSLTIKCTAAFLGLLCAFEILAIPTAIGPGRPGFDPDRIAIPAPVPPPLPCCDGIVYDNLVNPLGNYLGGFAYDELADDVELTGGGMFSLATIAYAGFNFDGDETLTLNLYRMDGAPTPGSFGFNTPGSLLYSQTVPIVATAGSLVTFADATPDVTLPSVVGVGLRFSGVDFDPTGAGSDAGPLLFDPPADGSSLDDYWLGGYPNQADPWALFTVGGNPPINLGIQIETVCQGVPDVGSTLSLLAVGLVAVSAFRAKRREA